MQKRACVPWKFRGITSLLGMPQKSKHPIESKPQIFADLADSFPDLPMGMFMARGAYDEGVIAKFKVAYNRKASALVYRLPDAPALHFEVASPLGQRGSEKPFGISLRIRQKGTA